MMVTTVLFTASAGQARGNPVVYTAELMAPVEAANHIIRGTVVKCAGTECRAGASSSSVKTVCAKLADEVGPLASFSYKGEPIDEAALAKCND
ncbi:CC_3452 family protein [Parasphingorhabdus halotolerans]|nr:hypothetical protein [Parasphingorhabdus halotolerans]